MGDEFGGWGLPGARLGDPDQTSTGGDRSSASEGGPGWVEQLPPLSRLVNGAVVGFATFLR